MLYVVAAPNVTNEPHPQGTHPSIHPFETLTQSPAGWHCFANTTKSISIRNQNRNFHLQQAAGSRSRAAGSRQQEPGSWQ